MKILALIPARGGSKGIPNKNIKLLGDKPLIAYVIEDARKSLRLSDVVVSTDSQAIASVAESFGAEVPFLRPAQLAEDTTPSIDVIVHTLQALRDMGRVYDAVCLLQPTSPFKKSNFIDTCIDNFIQSGADSFISVREVPHEFNPHWTFTASEQGLLQIATGDKQLIPRRQELPRAYYRDGSVYVSKVDLLENEHRIVGGRIAFACSDQEYYANLDLPADWIAAEKTLENLKKRSLYPSNFHPLSE